MADNGIYRKAHWVRIILASGAFFLFTHFAHGQYLFNERCQHAYNHILSLRFEPARVLLAEETRSDPSNLIPVYLENYIDFLTLFIGENRVQFDQLKGKKSERVRKLEQGTEDSPYHLFCLAEVNLQWAFARLKFGDYTSAALEIKKAHGLFTENSEKYPTFFPNKIGLGIVHILVGIVPDNYKWITNLMGVDGSLDLGLKELREVATYGGHDSLLLIYKQEAAFYLAIAASNLLKNKTEALSIVNAMEEAPSGVVAIQSPLAIYAKASVMMKNGLNDKALAVLEQRTSPKGSYHFFFLDYMEGLARLNKLDMDASANFNKYLEGFRGLNYIRSAYQKLAWISLIQGDTTKYEAYITLIKQRGASLVDEDKQAFQEATIGVRPSVILLKARLLFDGGYYQRALNELLDHPVKSFVNNRRDLVEYTYRLARIYHETGKLEKAISFYRQTIARGSNEPYYFAAASAFQMGLIYENMGHFSQADSAYRKCLSIESSEYKTSLDQKAKAGLNRLRKQGR